MLAYPFAIARSEFVLSQILEPELYPEISRVRGQMLGWRFHHHFRTDAESPLRQPLTDVFTPVLSSDGSDGQLRFLCLCADLFSPRPPALLALNEPETSIHPDLIDPLARLLVHAAKSTQLWITTH